MADLYEPDFGAAYYRSNDPVKNLKIHVKIERVTSSSIVPQASTEQVGSNVEMRSVKDEIATKDVDEFSVAWQQKVFSQREVEKYSVDDPEFGAMEKKYHTDVTLLLERGKPSNRLFSYVDHDQYTQQEETVTYMTTSVKEKPSILAEKMMHVRQRKVGGGTHASEKEGGFIPKINTVDNNPSDELRNKNHIMAAPTQVMYIMADLSPKDRTATEEEEVVLCTILMDANGVICIRPDFNRGTKPYIVESGGLGRNVFEYTIEHSSYKMNRQEQDKEMKMYREVYSRHKDFLDACVGDEFEMPPQGTLRLLVYGEIESCRNFEFDDLYLHFFVDLPKNWTAERHQQLSWVTQTCTTKVEGRDDVAYFSFPFSFELYYKDEAIREEDKEPLPHFPIVMVEVLSLDSWKRFRTEGYTYFNIPARPGIYKERSQCWRPIGKSIVSELRRFFIGGSPELEDLTYTAIPSTFQGSHLSKYGFRTETTGSVDVKLNVIMQSKSFMENKANKRSLGNLLDNLGINAVQANISSVLDAFKKARLRMMQARENATKQLIKEPVKSNRDVSATS